MNHPAKSKINYTALLISSITLIMIALGTPIEIKVEVLTITTLVGPPLIGVFRTWFTGSKE